VKAIGQILATMALALVVVAVCVFAAGDRQTLVPPPDVVGEGLLHQLATRRYDRVDSYVSHGRRDWSESALRRQFEPLWRYTGTVNQVDAELVSMGQDRARAMATAHGDAASARVLFELTREHGLWKVDAFSTDPPLPPEPLR
jgi:hypothetical protein